jgi:putative two-component system response regulator
MNETVMLIDDEVFTTQALATRLRKLPMNWQVVESNSVHDALEVLRGTHVDIIVSDIAMPGMDGFDLLDELNTRGMIEDVPVIMLTGQGDMATKRKALDLGATDLLSKPVELIDLQLRISNVLKLRASVNRVKKHERELLRMVAERTAELEYGRLALAIRLAKIAEMRDETTGNHTVRVGCFAEELANYLSFPQDFQQSLLIAAMMHDIGKIAIPDSVLLKQGSLTSEEWIIMQKHCELGVQILEGQPRVMGRVLHQRNMDSYESAYEDPVLAMSKTIALSHHEKWSGCGYPYGLSGNDIPIEARIVAVVDVFDALTASRPYRRAFTDSQAIQLMKTEHRDHFDPDVFAAFNECLPSILAIRKQIDDSEFTDIGRAA